jgi:hypothetical protein
MSQVPWPARTWPRAEGEGWPNKPERHGPSPAVVHDKEEALRNYQAWKKRRTDEILPADTRQRNKRART